MEILILDDDPIICHQLEIQIKRIVDAHIIYCHDGIKAVELIENNQINPSLIFCDLIMPMMDGVQFLRHAVLCGFKGSIVFMSGEDDYILSSVKVMAETYSVNVIASIKKPLSFTLLRDVIESATNYCSKEQVVIERIEQAMLEHYLEYDSIVPFVQLKYSLENGEIVGMEVLARIRTKDHTLIYPRSFIATAEQTNLIDTITWVLCRKVFEQVKELIYKGFSIPQISINFSMETLESLGTVDYLTEQVKLHNIEPSLVTIEVTESRVVENLSYALEVLNRARIKGFKLSLDDFGTGYASMETLMNIPFQELKIDQSFIKDALENRRAKTIVAHSVYLAKDLDLTTTAEGVASKKHWEFAKSFNIDMAQGYYLCKPFPLTEITKYLMPTAVNSNFLGTNSNTLSS